MTTLKAGDWVLPPIGQRNGVYDRDWGAKDRYLVCESKNGLRVTDDKEYRWRANCGALEFKLATDTTPKPDRLTVVTMEIGADNYSLVPLSDVKTVVIDGIKYALIETGKY